MLAAAQHAALDELRPAKRQRQHGLAAYVGPRGGHVLLGVRISVYWPDDHAFYKVNPFLPQQMPQSGGRSATFYDNLMAAAYIYMDCYMLLTIVNPAIKSPCL